MWNTSWKLCVLSCCSLALSAALHIFLPTLSGHISFPRRLQFTVHLVHPGTGRFVIRVAVSQWYRMARKSGSMYLHSDVCAIVFHHKPTTLHHMYCAFTSLYGNCSRERDVQVVGYSWWLQFDCTSPLLCRVQVQVGLTQCEFLARWYGCDGVACSSRPRVSESPGCRGRWCEECRLLGCYAVPSVSNLPTFRRNVLSHCSLQDASGSAFLRKGGQTARR